MKNLVKEIIELSEKESKVLKNSKRGSTDALMVEKVLACRELIKSLKEDDIKMVYEDLIKVNSQNEKSLAKLR